MIRKKRKAYFILLFIFVIISVILETEFRKFEDLSIDELLVKKYSSYQCDYIKSHQYFFVTGTKYKAANKSFSEIIRYNDDGTYFFFNSGIFPKKNCFKNYDINSTNCSFGVYKEDNKYIIYVSEAFSENNSTVYDNNGNWESINGNSIAKQKYWFKVIEHMDNDYTIYFKIGNEIYTMTTKKHLEDMFS